MVRHASFMRLREDKRPDECRAEDGEMGREKGHLVPEPLPVEPALERTIAFTNPDKVFWPGPGYTKGDLIDYYRVIAPWLLPYLADRPLVLTRYPDGITGKSFYQKDAPDWVPDWIRTVTVWSREFGAGTQLLRGGRHRHASLPGQSRDHPTPHLAQPDRHARTARLVLTRPGPEGRSIRARRRGRPCPAYAVQRVGTPALRETSGSSGLTC